MERRWFIALVGATAIVPGVPRAQGVDRVRRLGWLDNLPATASSAQGRTAAVKEELAKLGWTVGRNLEIEVRDGIKSPEDAKRAAAELIALSPDVVLCIGSPGVKAFQAATSTVPVIFIQVAEPVSQGVVPNFPRPGGNITGFAYLEHTVGAKWMEFLKRIAPEIKRVAYVFSPKAAPYAPLYYQAARVAAESLGVVMTMAPVDERDAIEPIVAALGEGGGLIFNPDAFINGNVGQEIDLAARYRIPAIFAWSYAAEAGALITYSLDQLVQFRQTAAYIDRILKGEKAGNLPVQLPTKFELVVNLKTAKALGLDVPQLLLAQADDVVE
jgi:putative tryptophan/tyrosine transport system substrate-binding protein